MVPPMSGAPATCAQCGEPLGSGRFCTNCGASVSGSGSDTNPRLPRVPAPAPTSAPDPTGHPPEVMDVPPAPRYPLYADEAVSPHPPSYVSPPTEAPAGAPPASPQHSAGSPGIGLWVGAAVVLLAVVLIGGWLLLRGGGASGRASPNPPLVPPQTSHASRTASATGKPSPSVSTTASQPGAPGEVAPFAHASAPAHAPAGVDVDGNPVTFVAGNLLDGSPTTCWRRAGDATGTVITIRLDQPTRLTGVGLINGYAKVSSDGGRRFDWYAGNRRVLSVDWLFDDGSRVSQAFGSSRAVQRMAVDPVTTSTVRIRITEVSPPGTGRAARNDTAISEVSLLGRPA
jgi:hypothetical protein